MSAGDLGNATDYRWLQPQQAPFELRGLDLALAKLVRQRTGSVSLARLCAWLSAAERQGHAALDVDAEQLHSALHDYPKAQAWVGNGETVTPLVWADERLSLWRNWQHEAIVADALRERCAEPVEPSAPLQAALDQLHPHPDSADQRRALSAALSSRFFVLTGGPGTGKTSTVLRLLLLLQLQRGKGEGPLRYALAAPTGKAAARVAQALRRGRRELAGQLTEQSSRTLLEQLPEEASTLHRLLAYNPGSDRFERNRRRPLGADVVVVDEASMVDLALMRALVDALAPSATLVLVGDADQLVSVSAGSVLADVVSAASDPRSPLRHGVGRLRHVWRTGSGLASVYALLRDGDLSGLNEALKQPDRYGCRLLACLDAEQLTRRVDHWLSSDSVLASLQPGDDLAPDLGLQLMARHQLLCATRSGPFGATAINAQIDARLRQRRGNSAQWYPGRRVMITHNDHARRLYNGDVGVALVDQGSLRICFESSATGAARWLLPQELPEHELAFAMTIHKSQGSEYEHVAVILPPDPQHPLLSRQLLYTAVSRARSSAQLWSSGDAIAAALARVLRRQGGLAQRLEGPGLRAQESNSVSVSVI